MVIHLGGEASAAHFFLSGLRDVNRQKDKLRFRLNLERLGEIMAYELSKKLAYEKINVQTPLGLSQQYALPQPPVLLAILRAALPFLNGFQRIFEESETGFIGAYRKESSEADGKISVQTDYVATPNLDGKDIILIDPMLATGTSVCDNILMIKKRFKPKSIHLACVLATPEGIQKVESTLGVQQSIWTFQIDEKLNPQAYIVPGLGDAGDLAFGEKI